MIELFPFYLAIIVVIILLIMAAGKLKIAYPILLVTGGLLISLIPGIPAIHIESELIFFIFLPPLLYEAAWSISWKELWHWRRIISSFAFVVVLLTAIVVALVTNHFIPGFSMALGFLLGGIVSPPDAVSASAILKTVKVRRALVSILEGESLLNDASALIIFRFALIAVATGQFIWYDAALSFSWMLVGGIGIGLALGWAFMKGHKYLPTDANMDIVLTIVAPYTMYFFAEEIHSSGVLAVVSGGLLMSNRRLNFLSSNSRLKGENVWQSLVFVFNGLVFMFIGLDLPEIVNGLGKTSLLTAVGYGVLVTVVLIIARIISAYGAVVTTLIMRNFITVADTRNPGMKGPLLIGWTGMRGVVSLASALSIPTHLADGTLFPQRNLILFITFIVILLTLTVQGLTLPALVRKLNIPDPDDTHTEEQVETYIKTQLANEALGYLRTHYSNEIHLHPALQQMAEKWERSNVLTGDEALLKDFKGIYLDIINHQRQWLIQKNKEKFTLNEAVIREAFLSTGY